MSIFCLGDLVLDVIVRLEQPLATGADATSRIVLRPGGQAANVAAWIAALGGSSHFVGKRGADDAGAIAASRLRDLGVGLLGPVEPTGNGVIVALVDPSGERTMCPDRGVAVELRPEEIDEAWFAECDSPPRLGVRAAARARPLRRDPGDRMRARARRAGQHRPLVVERDSGRRRRAVPRPARRARARRRLRQRGGGRDRRRPDRRRHLDPQARRRGGVVRRRRASRRAASSRSSTRPVRAMPSRPAGSSAGRSSLSRPAPAACSSPDRCRRAPARLVGDARPDPRQRRGADRARGGARRRRARDDARRPRVPRAGRRRDGPRERGCRSRGRSRSGHDRRARRADPDRPRPSRARAVHAEPPASSALAISPSAPSRERSARRPSAAR